jgi:hypothetical protein
LYQVSNNCKDPGVQEYGGPLFRALRADTEDIFLTLPPPTVSCATHNAAPPNMAVYADYSGACFAGECLVEMHDGTTKRVHEIKKGDVVSGGATVACVVVTDTTTGTGRAADMWRVGDLLVTAWHPIRGDTGRWVFPCEVEGAVLVRGACRAVYNFVLEPVAGLTGHKVGHEVVIAGRGVVTLGHGLDGPVVAHAYFGTRAVISDLESASGWETGLVRLAGTLRDTDGLVCGLIAQ